MVYDPDDDPVRFYGHEAAGAERQTIAKLVTRYYADAARHDGVITCRMMLSSAIREFVSQYSQRAHSTRCSDVASFEFKQMQDELKNDVATLEVVSIRVKDASGVVLLRFQKARDLSTLSIQREAGTWKLAQALAQIHMV